MIFRNTLSVISIILLLFLSILGGLPYITEFAIGGEIITPVGANWTLETIYEISPESVSKSGGDYIVHENITVNYGATLTILPGTIVKFDKSKSIKVYGKLISRGEEDSKIKFTSSAAVPSIRDWDGLIFELRGDNNNNSLIKYSIIEYSNNGITCRSASPRIFYSSITNCQNGIYGDSGSSPEIKHSQIIDNNFWGIRLTNADTEISNCTISDNYYGIYSQGSKLTIRDNIIDNSTLHGALLKGGEYSLNSNSFEYNGKSSSGLYPGIKCENSIVYLRSNKLISNSHAGIESVNSRIDSNRDIFLNNLAGLDISKGSTAYLDEVEVYASKEHGLRIYDSVFDVSNSTISDCGWSDVTENELYTGVYIYNSSGNFRFNTVARNGFMGIAIEDSDVQIESSSFMENNMDSIYIWYSSPIINNCTFQNPGRYNINADLYSQPSVLNFFGDINRTFVVDDTAAIKICRSLTASINDFNGNALENAYIEIYEKNSTTDIDRLIYTSDLSDNTGKIKPFALCFQVIQNGSIKELFEFSRIISPTEIDWGMYIIAAKDDYWGNEIPLEFGLGPIGYDITMNKKPELELTTEESAYSGLIKGVLELEGNAWDDGGIITAVYFKCDNNIWHEAQLIPPGVNGSGKFKWRINLDTRTLSSGTHTLFIKASEGAGNSSAIELNINVDNPLGDTDSDGDGLTYAEEIYFGTDPNSTDTDSDGIPDGVELDSSDGYQTSPVLSDSDFDGVSDGDEDRNRNGRVDRTETDPNNADTDGDGVPDGKDDFPLDNTMWKSSETDDMKFFRVLTIFMVIIVIILVIAVVLVLVKTRKKNQKVPARETKSEQILIKKSARNKEKLEKLSEMPKRGQTKKKRHK